MFIQVLVEVLVNVTLKNVRGVHQVCRTLRNVGGVQMKHQMYRECTIANGRNNVTEHWLAVQVVSYGRNVFQEF